MVPGVVFSICFRADLRGKDRSSGYTLDYYVGWGDIDNSDCDGDDDAD